MSFLGQVFLEAPHLPLAQIVDCISILARHMKAVDHDPRVRKHLLGCRDVAVPDIGTDRRDLSSDGSGDALEPGDHGGFQPIRQHRQQIQIALLGLRADDGHKVAMAFEERDLVNSDGRKRRQGRPLNALGDETVENAENRISGDIFLGLDIAQGAIDQLHDQMALVGLGMQRTVVIPVERLRGGRMALASRTAEALGTDAQIDDPTEARQMAKQPRLVQAMPLADGAATATAGCTRYGAFDREDKLAVLGEFGLEDADIGDVERD